MFVIRIVKTYILYPELQSSKKISIHRSLHEKLRSHTKAVTAINRLIARLVSLKGKRNY